MSRRHLIALVAGALLAGCGTKGDPEPPPEEKKRFPRKYPRKSSK